LCNESYNPPRLFLDVGYEITDISPRGELYIWVPTKRECYDSSGGLVSRTSSSSTGIFLGTSSYLLSVNNSFFFVGCPNQGYFEDADGFFVSGCPVAELP
jgi:hypothetical protein